MLKKILICLLLFMPFNDVLVAHEDKGLTFSVNESLPFKRGLYQHYRGSYYQVLGICRHSETLEEMVVYQALGDDYGLWVRPRAMFEELTEVNGKKKPRFKFIRVLLEEPPLLRK